MKRLLTLAAFLFALLAFSVSTSQAAGLFFRRGVAVNVNGFGVAVNNGFNNRVFFNNGFNNRGFVNNRVFFNNGFNNRGLVNNRVFFNNGFNNRGFVNNRVFLNNGFNNRRNGFNNNVFAVRGNRAFFAPSNVFARRGFVGNGLVSINANPFASQAVLVNPSAAFGIRQQSFGVPAISSFQSFGRPVIFNNGFNNGFNTFGARTFNCR